MLLPSTSGFTVTCTSHFAVYSGCRMMFYEMIRDHVFKRNSNGQYPLWYEQCSGHICFDIVLQIVHEYRKAIPTGMIAGAMGQFLASPTDLVKVRLQMEGRRVLDGYKPRYKIRVMATLV